jgi:hypothetical protein
MPYIPKDSRQDFEQEIKSIIEKLGHVSTDVTCAGCIAAMKENAAKGELNFIIASVIGGYVTEHGLRYHRLNDFICGVLESCKLELVRRLTNGYEDKCIEKNGDLPCFKQ